MPLKTLVKVGQLTNLSDARYCAGMGVDMLGFQVIPGPDTYVQPSAFQEIRGWITGPQIVAEVYGLTSADALQEILENYKPDYLQMGPSELSLFSSLHLPVIISLKPGDELPANTIVPAFVLVNDLKNYSHNLPVLVAVASVDAAIDSLSNPIVKGIAMQGSAEISPGMKSYDALAEILEMLEDDN